MMGARHAYDVVLLGGLTSINLCGCDGVVFLKGRIGNDFRMTAVVDFDDIDFVVKIKISIAARKGSCRNVVAVEIYACLE